MNVTFDYTETQKKRLRHEATRRDRAAIKSSMLAYRAQQAQSVAEMRKAELEAGKKRAAARAADSAAKNEGKR